MKCKIVEFIDNFQFQVYKKVWEVFIFEVLLVRTTFLADTFFPHRKPTNKKILQGSNFSFCKGYRVWSTETKKSVDIWRIVSCNVAPVISNGIWFNNFYLIV